MDKEIGDAQVEIKNLNLRLCDSGLKYKEVLELRKADMKKVAQKEKERMKAKYNPVILTLKSVIDAKEATYPLLVRLAEQKMNRELISKLKDGEIKDLDAEV